MTIEKVFDLAIANSTNIKISDNAVTIARQQISLNQLYRVPTITSGLSFGYISNADIWNPSFSKHQKAAIPHQFTQFSMQATETLFKGNQINNLINKSILEGEVAEYNNSSARADIKLLAVTEYLDIYRLRNRHKIYINNLVLAQHRLSNILSMKNQGMVTRNDVLRNELIISDLQLTINKVAHGITQLNNALTMILGLPDSISILPDSAALLQQTSEANLTYFIAESKKQNPNLQIALQEIKIAENNLKLVKGEKLPELGLYASANLQRPYTFAIPAVDIYFNVYQAGVFLRYNISSIYQSPRKIRLAKAEVEQANLKALSERQKTEIAVKNSFIRFQESKYELETLRNNLVSAEENYRIVEKKYFNQLALLTEVIDATNIKIESEIKVTDMEINIIQNYYQLLESAGLL